VEIWGGMGRYGWEDGEMLWWRYGEIWVGGR